MDQLVVSKTQIPSIFMSARGGDPRVRALRDTEQLRSYSAAAFSRLDYLAGFTATLPFGRVHSAEVFIAGVNHAKVTGSRYIVAGENDAILAESIPKKARNALRLGQDVERHHALFASVERGFNGPCAEHFDGVCALIAQRNDNYGHWHMDVLSSVVLLQELKLDADVTLLSSELKSYRRKSLELLGINLDRVREIPDSAITDQHISCDRLLFPSLLSVNYGNIPLWQQRVFDRVLQAVLLQYGNDKSRYPRRVYVDRSGDPKRKCLNEADLIARLRDLDFAIFTPKNFSYEEQVLTFANADCIVGCMGAGLVNCGFARRGATVIEIKPPKHHRTNLWKTFATLAGARHHSILTPVDQPVTEDGAWHIPDIDKTVADIRGLMQEPRG